jgi:hypothetical protein
MPTHISLNFAQDKLESPSLDDLIDVFEDRMKYWLIEPAKQIMEYPGGQIAGFCLFLTYFEGVWGYIKGGVSKRQSTAFFKNAFVDVFRSSGINEALLTRVAQVFYDDARCGFFHDGMFRERIFFESLENGVLLITLPKTDGRIDENGEIQSILVDPKRFAVAVERHFVKFITILRNPTETEQRTKFESMCRDKWGLGSDARVIGILDPTKA